MNAERQPSTVKSRTVHYAAICLALALPHASSAHAQCHTDPVTGQRVCAVAPEPLPGARAPALDSALLAPGASAHCRVSVSDGSTGSGTLIAVDPSGGFILTCAHLFDRSTSGIVVTFADGARFAARLAAIDRAHDLAALAIGRPHFQPLAVSDEEPSGTLTACGFGADGWFRCIRGAIVGQALAAGATHPCLAIAGTVRPGDSGGGVLNARGQLVGVVWGQREGRTYATCGRPVREFLDRILRNAPRPAPPSPGTPVQLAWQAWARDIESRIRTLDAKKQDKGPYLQTDDLHGYLKIEDVPKFDATPFARRAEVDSRLKSLATRCETLQARVEDLSQHLEKLAAARAGLFQGLSLGKLVAGALGLSSPLAAAVLIVCGLALRRRKRHSAAPGCEASDASGTAQHGAGRTRVHPIAVDSPPPPQRTLPETHYVSVEKDTFAHAHQWASEQVSRKYPGATEILQAQDSLIKQYLSAH